MHTPPVSTPRSRAAFAAPLLLLTGMLACHRVDTPAPAVAAAATGPVTVDVTRVVSQPLDVQLSLPGELTPYQSVAIHPRVSGFVKSVVVDRGSVVRAGDLLATLDAPELVAQRAEAQSRLHAAEAQLAGAQSRADADRSTFERLEAASSTPGVVAGNDLVIAEKAAEASQSLVAAGRQQVEAAQQAAQAISEMEGYLRVTAPFAGVITDRHVHPGALVGPGAGSDSLPMLRLAEHRRLRLVVAVPEAYTAEMTRGAAIPFSVAAFPGQTWSGSVARVAQAVDVATRTMAVELDVENADGRLAPGTFCQVRWPVRRTSPSMFVPSGSIASTTDRTFVIRVHGGKAEWIDVKTGLTAGRLVEVFGKLQPGDEIASRGTDEVHDGASVRPRETEPPA